MWALTWYICWWKWSSMGVLTWKAWCLYEQRNSTPCPTPGFLPPSNPNPSKVGDGQIIHGDGCGGVAHDGGAGACDRSMSFKELCILLNAAVTSEPPRTTNHQMSAPTQTSPTHLLRILKVCFISKSLLCISDSSILILNRCWAKKLGNIGKVIDVVMTMSNVSKINISNIFLNNDDLRCQRLSGIYQMDSGFLLPCNFTKTIHFILFEKSSLWVSKICQFLKCKPVVMAISINRERVIWAES